MKCLLILVALFFTFTLGACTENGGPPPKASEQTKEKKPVPGWGKEAEGSFKKD